jgi:hypothetical protein
MGQKMTVADVERFVRGLRIEAEGDGTAFRMAQDTLFLAVLEQIADGDGTDAELARAALKTTELDFSRASV